MNLSSIYRYLLTVTRLAFKLSVLIYHLKSIITNNSITTSVQKFPQPFLRPLWVTLYCWTYFTHAYNYIAVKNSFSQYSFWLKNFFIRLMSQSLKEIDVAPETKWLVTCDPWVLVYEIVRCSFGLFNALTLKETPDLRVCLR